VGRSSPGISRPESLARFVTRKSRQRTRCIQQHASAATGPIQRSRPRPTTSRPTRTQTTTASLIAPCVTTSTRPRKTTVYSVTASIFMCHNAVPVQTWQWTIGKGRRLAEPELLHHQAYGSSCCKDYVSARRFDHLSHLNLVSDLDFILAVRGVSRRDCCRCQREALSRFAD
jgi:hypothetical protein